MKFSVRIKRLAIGVVIGMSLLVGASTPALAQHHDGITATIPATDAVGSLGRSSAATIATANMTGMIVGPIGITGATTIMVRVGASIAVVTTTAITTEIVVADTTAAGS